MVCYRIVIVCLMPYKSTTRDDRTRARLTLDCPSVTSIADFPDDLTHLPRLKIIGINVF